MTDRKELIHHQLVKTGVQLIKYGTVGLINMMITLATILLL